MRLTKRQVKAIFPRNAAVHRSLRNGKPQCGGKYIGYPAVWIMVPTSATTSAPKQVQAGVPYVRREYQLTRKKLYKRL